MARAHAANGALTVLVISGTLAACGAIRPLDGAQHEDPPVGPARAGSGVAPVTPGVNEVGAGPTLPPPGPLYTLNSAIFHDISEDASRVYFTSTSRAGTVDPDATAAIEANAGGPGIHAFNPEATSGPRRRASLFVAQERSTSCTFAIDLGAHAADKPGKKVAIAIAGGDGAVLASTAIALERTASTYRITYSTTPGAEYQAWLSNDPALHADPAARAYVGAQSVRCAGAAGIFARDYYRMHVTGRQWFSNLDTFPKLAYWSYTTGRGESASTFAWLPITTDAPWLVVESGSIAFTQKNELYSGFDLQIDDTIWQRHPNTIGPMLEHTTCPLLGVPSTVNLYNPGRNFMAAQWSGTLHRAIYFPASASFSVATNELVRRPIVVAPADSISDGFMAFPPAQRAWVPLVRAATGRTVYCDATGGNTIYAYGSHPYDTDEARKIASVNPEDVIWAIGTNDYEREDGAKLSLGNVMAYAGLLLDAIHAANPTARVWMLTPWNKTAHEPPHLNYAGHTLTDWRNALYQLARDRGNPAWLRAYETVTWTRYASFVNDDYCGELTTPNDLVHPNSRGNLKIAARIEDMLGDDAMAIAAPAAPVATGSSQSLVVKGGRGGNEWSLIANGSGGSIDAHSGVYRAGPQPAVDVVKVIDAHSQVSTVAITVE